MVFEHHESPDDYVIENNRRLDAWVKRQSDEAKERRKGNNNNNDPGATTDVIHFD